MAGRRCPNCNEVRVQKTFVYVEGQGVICSLCADQPPQGLNIKPLDKERRELLQRIAESEEA